MGKTFVHLYCPESDSGKLLLLKAYMNKLFCFCFFFFMACCILVPNAFAQSYDRHFRTGDGSTDFNLIQGTGVFEGLNPNGHDSLTVKWSIFDVSKGQRVLQSQKFLMQSIDTMVFGGPADSVVIRIVSKVPSNAAEFTLGSSDTLFAGLDSVIFPAVGQAGIASSTSLPQGNIALQCFPNPGHDNVVIEITLLQSDHLRLELFDETGRMVRDLGTAALESGTHSIECSMQDDDDRTLPNGSYIFLARNDVGSASLKLSVSH